MQARDLMTAAVVSVPQDGTIADVTKLMIDHHVSAFSVIDGEGMPVGLVSEGDLMRRVRDSEAPRRSW